MALTIRTTVVTTPTILKVFNQIKKCFEDVNVEISSGLRSPEKQLEIIKHFCKKHGLEKEFPNYETFDLNKFIVLKNGDKEYEWQYLWSKELVIGLVVNPPFDARCKFDYYTTSKKLVKAGTLLRQTPHTSGKCFDLSGAPLNKIASCLDRAKKEFKADIVGYKVEPKQNCVHVDCQ